MDATKFDSITRSFGRRVSRRAVLQAAALGGAAAAAPTAFRRASAQTSAASALVQRLYENIDAYQYSQAYDLLGSKWHSQQSLDNFTKGYANTAFVQCEPTGEHTSGGVTTVSVKLISWHNDGKIVGYTGSYTVGTENGKLLILGGNNTPGNPPAGTPPLCKIADLKFAFGPWDAAAGSRNSSIVATNKSQHSCALGGSPRVELTDNAKHTVRSTSQEGSLPVAIMVAPGDSAHAPLRFSNWCGGTGNPASVVVDIPADVARGTVDFSQNGISYPPCLGQGQAAVLEIKGFTNAA
jgi:hypothetical protein